MLEVQSSCELRANGFRGNFGAPRFSDSASTLSSLVLSFDARRNFCSFCGGIVGVGPVPMSIYCGEKTSPANSPTAREFFAWREKPLCKLVPLDERVLYRCVGVNPFVTYRLTSFALTTAVAYRRFAWVIPSAPRLADEALGSSKARRPHEEWHRRHITLAVGLHHIRIYCCSGAVSATPSGSNGSDPVPLLFVINILIHISNIPIQLRT